MKRLLNTLYVTSQGAYLSRERETVVVRVEHETRFRLPIHALDGIVCFGRVSCSPQLMALCGERNVTLSFLSEQGRFLARVHGPVSGNVLLRRQQYRKADDDVASAALARALVSAKIANARTTLLRAARQRSDCPAAKKLEMAVSRLARLLEKLRLPLTSGAARGIEGDAARAYFAVLDHLIVAQKQDFFFHGRNRRPPLDNVNALLSFLYALVTRDTVSALEAVGLDPAVGFLHTDRPGRPGLALDLVEELRSCVADRLALALINRQQVRPKGFKKTESGAVEMDEKTRRQVLVAYHKRKQDDIYHPFLDEKMPVGLIPHAQAMLLARYLRGDLDGYPPFFWK